MSEQILKNYKNTFNNMSNLLNQMLNSKDQHFIDNKRQQTIKLLENFVQHLEITDYLLIDCNPIVPKDVFIEMYFNLGTLYKNQTENVLKQNNNILTKEHENNFRTSLNCFYNILRISFENEMAIKQIVSIFTHLCFFSQNDLQKSLSYLQEALIYSPGNETIHYNIGHIFQKLNKLEMSLIHYKLSLNLILANLNKKEDLKEAEALRLNCLNGISYIFRSIKQWPQSLY